MPPDLLERSRRYVRSLKWFVRGMEDDDLVSVFVLGGLLACRDGFSWGRFIAGGKFDLLDAMRSANRIGHTAFRESFPIDGQFNLPDKHDAYRVADDRLTVDALLNSVELSDLQRTNIEEFLSGRRDNLWGSGSTTPEGRQIANAVYKAMLKLREVAHYGTGGRNATT